MRFRHFVAALVVICGNAAVSAQTPPETVHVEPNARIPFSLERGAITRTLPFDVRFYLISEVPAGAKKGTGRIAKDVGCKEFGPLLAPTTPTTPPTLVESKPFPTPDKANSSSMEFQVDKLDVDRDYCFEFDLQRERSEEERKKFLAAIRPVLVDVYRRANPVTVAHAVDGSFRKEILDAVKLAVAPAQVVKEDAPLLLPEERNAIGKGATYPRVITPGDLRIRMLTERPLEIVQQIQRQVRNFREDFAQTPAIGSTPLTRDDVTDEAIAEEVERVRGRIAAEGADSPKGKDLAFVLTSLIKAQDLMVDRDTAIDAVASEIDKSIVNSYDVVATTTAGYEGRFHWYVTADMGIAVSPEIDDVFPYIGMNVALRPINKKAPLEGLSLSRRFAFTVGLGGEKLTTGNVTGVIDSRPVLLGGGLRIYDFIRVSAGAQLFHEDDPDPLVTDRKLAVTPYYGLSVDVDIASIVRGFFANLPGK